ncbi:C-type mannose receptor 2-like [Penaeus japonicus]|uniref:C-type mannose receptor 2-like n=1 Tax=Penaeus japonicus TaxID=27405 RepID=UPI001C7125AF|nr:C-type mannose receptor 2-like [Penaeus japonicus]
MDPLRWLTLLLTTAVLCRALNGRNERESPPSAIANALEDSLSRQARGETYAQPWYPIGDSSFLVSNGTAKWYEAYVECHELGGSLASISSQTENDSLSGLLTALSVDSAWIGLSDTELESVFKWAEGELTFLNFAPGEPSDSGDHSVEDCVEMRRDLDFRWNDEYRLRRGDLCVGSPIIKSYEA